MMSRSMEPSVARATDGEDAIRALVARGEGPCCASTQRSGYFPGIKDCKDMTLSNELKPRTGRQASHSGVVTSVAFSPDGRTLASGSWDGTIKLWAAQGGKLKLRRTLRGEWDEVEAVAFAPDGSAIAGLGTGFDAAPFGAVMLWALEGGRGRPLTRASGKLDAIAFSPDGLTLATASGDTRTVTLWDVETGRERASLSGHQGPTWSLAFSPDGRRLAVACGRVPAGAEPVGDGPIGEI